MLSRHLKRSSLRSRGLVGVLPASRRGRTATAPTPDKVTSILVANRGEIAYRICRTAAQHGIPATTVYTDADAGSQHILASPFSFNLGKPSAYLDGDSIIKAAKAQGCDAVHPGYGFLSENAGFARSCAQAGLNFIGPSWEAIEAMGDKSRSKEIMLGVDVPCIPGYHGSNQEPSFLQEQAAQIGYPVLLKAVHGGGGKGMRIAQSPDDFLAQLESAKSEARNSFGNDTMLVEKYITRPRHVEVQIFGDKLGNVVALGERDCSIQRRHQKIIEESPAPDLSTEQRHGLWHKAIQAGKAVNYVGAGTVEFILDAENGGFYFMEMNTRLQVEHPVTEMCTGLDLVEWQLRVARGEPLPLEQEQIEESIGKRGHAVEARIYAENPRLNFLPTAGTVTYLNTPKEVEDAVRIDTAINKAPVTISSHYDPMISKLIVRGPDRGTALRKMKMSLDEYQIAGLATNIEFLKQLCMNEAFIAAGESLETGFIDKHRDELFPATTVPPEVWVQAALGLAIAQNNKQMKQSAVPSLHKPVGFASAVGNESGSGKASIQLTEARDPGSTAEVSSASIALLKTGEDTYNASVSTVIPASDQYYEIGSFANIQVGVSHSSSPNVYTVTSYLPHTRLQSTIVLNHELDPDNPQQPITIFDRGQRYDLMVPPPVWLTQALGKSATSAEASLAAPMPSKILRVEVSPGASVLKDQPLVVVESMKMEMVIRAPSDGLVVKKVPYGPGDICKAGATLIEFEAPDAAVEDTK